MFLEDKINTYIGKFTVAIIEPLIWLLMSVSVIIFVYGLVKYAFTADEKQDERQKAKKHIIWSMVGFILIFGAWGIMVFISHSVDSIL